MLKQVANKGGSAQAGHIDMAGENFILSGHSRGCFKNELRWRFTCFLCSDHCHGCLLPLRLPSPNVQCSIHTLLRVIPAVTFPFTRTSGTQVCATLSTFDMLMATQK